MDRYHIYQEILRKIKDKRAQQNIRKLFDKEEIEEMLEYIEAYANGVESSDENDKKSKHARELINTIDRYTDGLIFNMPILDAMQTASRKAFRKAFGC